MAIHPALIDSHHFYGGGKPMTEAEQQAASMLRPVSKPLGLYNWMTTDGQEWGKGYTAIRAQAGINERTKATP